MRRIAVFLTLAALLAGCGVSKQVVAEKDAALEACRGQEADCRSQLDACARKASQLQDELDRCKAVGAEAASDLEACARARTAVQADLATCQQESAAAKAAAAAALAEAKALKERENDLRTRLQQEIQNKTVEIENLRGKLSVRVLDKILFDSGSAEILPDGKQVLEKLAGAVKDSDEMIRVEGHTDDVPIGPALKSKYFSNWELSAARASSVVRYFQHAQGIAPERLEAVGLSMYRPVASNDTPEGRQRNRRVEVVLTAAPR